MHTATEQQPSKLISVLPAGNCLAFFAAPGDEAHLENTLSLALTEERAVTLVFVGDDAEIAAQNVAKMGVTNCLKWNYPLNDSVSLEALYTQIQAQLLSAQPALVFAPGTWQETETAARLSALVTEAVSQSEVNAELWFYAAETATAANACIQQEHFYRLSSAQLAAPFKLGLLPKAAPAYQRTIEALQAQHYPLISVVVRTQNRPHLLVRALQSLAAQTYPRVEAVVVNDGGCEINEIIQRFTPLISGGLQYIRQSQAQGRSRAANAGIQAAQGEWLAFLDDDDTFEIEGLSRLARFIHWDKSVIYGQVRLLKMHGESKQSEQIGLFAESYNPDTLLLNNYVPICAYICQRARALALGGFDEDFEFLEDWDFFYRLTRGVGVYYVEELISNYCVWGESYTTGKQSVQENFYREQFFAKHLPHLTPAELQRASLDFVKLRDQANNELHQYYKNSIQQSEAHKQQIETALQQQAQAVSATQEQNRQLAQENHRLDAEMLVWKERLQVANQNLQAHQQELNNLRTTLATTMQRTHELQNALDTLKQAQLVELEKLKQVQHSQLSALTQDRQQWIHETRQCQHNAEHLTQTIKQLEAVQHFTSRRWTERSNALLKRAAFNLAFDRSGAIVDLSAYGWTPILQAFIAHNSSVHNLTPAYAEIEFPFPMTHNTRVRWVLDWFHAVPIDALLLKIGTYLRRNLCTLELHLIPQEAGNTEIIQATLRGENTQDHSFAALQLSRPLRSGRYLCELYSPDTDNTENLMGIWLTSNHKRRSGYASPHYHYVAPQRETLHKIQEKLTYRPLISVVIPTYNTPAIYLRACLDSIVAQIYPYWEICIADDASTQPQVRAVLQDYQARFPQQIKVHYGATNQHISGASNAALALAEGEFVALLDHDDWLTEDALLEMVRCLNDADQPDAIDLIYSDEDKWDEDRQVFDEPHFKPDWSPENLRGQMYIGHLGMYRTRRMREIKGFRLGIEGSQDWDLALRITELGGVVKHIPKVLYHWRKHGGSTAGNIGQKNYAVEAGLQVVRDALEREHQGGKASFAFGSSYILVQYPVPAAEQALVSIIIPNKDQAELLKVCLDSITQNNSYKNWEIIIIDNGSKSKAVKKLYKKYESLLARGQFRVHWDIAPFNFSKMVNLGAQQAKGEYFLLLNNDTQLISPGNWLEEMVGYARRKSIGGVGCKLLYPDNTLQHAGIVCGLGGVANHSHKFFPVTSPGYIGRLHIVSNYSGATAACLMVRRELWEEMGGFDESLQVAFNDVDFCLRILAAGYRHVVLPQVWFYHFESKSRGEEDNPLKQQRFAGEVETMERRWKKSYISHDPYYSPHLTKQHMDFSIDEKSPYYCERDYEELL